MPDVWAMGITLHEHRNRQLVRADAITHLLAIGDKETGVERRRTRPPGGVSE
ncbi:hypothetical protein [Streptomyces agglomeratus]|uniref:hypothetical protein n=1 Tax=Streptomyces agglomeratus TaxID=285458 RepID=UPI00159EF8F5|nr:hypothetical protein [Streptomyces agglomeratus]